MDFAADVPLQFADFGLVASYRLGTAPAVSCRVIEDRNVDVYGEYGQVVARRTALSFIAAQVPAPARGAVVTAGTRSWVIDRVTEDDGYTVKALTQ